MGRRGVHHKRWVDRVKEGMSISPECCWNTSDSNIHSRDWIHRGAATNDYVLEGCMGYKRKYKYQEEAR